MLYLQNSKQQFSGPFGKEQVQAQPKSVLAGPNIYCFQPHSPPNALLHFSLSHCTEFISFFGIELYVSLFSLSWLISPFFFSFLLFCLSFDKNPFTFAMILYGRQNTDFRALKYNAVFVIHFMNENFNFNIIVFL